MWKFLILKVMASIRIPLSIIPVLGMNAWRRKCRSRVGQYSSLAQVRYIMVFCCTMILIGGFVTLTLPAQAKAHSPNASCQGNGCEGQDPVSAGCWTDNSGANVAGTYIADSMPVRDVGTVNLWYSNACGANWGEIVGNAGCTSKLGENITSEQAIIMRPGQTLFSANQQYVYPMNAGTCKEHSAMTYAPTTPIQVCGVINHVSQPLTCVTQAGFY